MPYIPIEYVENFLIHQNLQEVLTGVFLSSNIREFVQQLDPNYNFMQQSFIKQRDGYTYVFSSAPNFQHFYSLEITFCNNRIKKIHFVLKQFFSLRNLPFISTDIVISYLNHGILKKQEVRDSCFKSEEYMQNGVFLCGAYWKHNILTAKVYQVDDTQYSYDSSTEKWYVNEIPEDSGLSFRKCYAKHEFDKKFHEIYRRIRKYGTVKNESKCDFS